MRRLVRAVSATALIAAFLRPVAALAVPVAGTVVDASLKMPLAGAAVTVTFANGRRVQATTDGQGRFSVEAASAPESIAVSSGLRYPRVLFQGDELARALASPVVLRVGPALHVISIDSPHDACAAFQTAPVFVQYTVQPGRCGVPARFR